MKFSKETKICSLYGLALHKCASKIAKTTLLWSELSLPRVVINIIFHIGEVFENKESIYFSESHIPFVIQM